MGALVHEGTGRICVLEAHHLVGRSHRCSLRFPEKSSVSLEHASLRWTGRTWVIKDLGSRFGTYLNAQRLPSGTAALLEKGARLAFGREKDTWVLSDESPPEVMVVPVDGGPALLRVDGMIAIPSLDCPVAVVFQGADGRWVLDQGGHVTSIHEHEPFVVKGASWRLCNASPLPPTSMAGEGRETVPLEEVELRFKVSRNEEHVDLGVAWRGRILDMGARAHHYLLLTLARLRLQDVEEGEPPASAGWIDQEELLEKLQATPEKLNLDIFRIRRQFGAAGFVPAAAIVERRPLAKALRIGVGRIKIDTV